MEKLERYAQVIKEVLTENARFAPSHGNIEPTLVFDDEHRSYQLMYLGWDGPRRVHSTLIHIRLRDGKVWIEADGTEEGVAPSLQARGVAKHDIVLAFYSETKRQYTEFAVA
jgi:hypothetical protein